MAQTAKPVQLKPRTLEAFDVYIHQAKMEMEQNLQSSGPFLWSDVNSKQAQQVREGKVVAQFWSAPISVENGRYRARSPTSDAFSFDVDFRPAL